MVLSVVLAINRNRLFIERLSLVKIDQTPYKCRNNQAGTRMMKFLTLMATSAILLLGCSSLPANHSSSQGPTANAAAIEGHMLFLASDELEGRDTGSRGHEIASLYIATQLQALGLQPAGDDGSYFQQVPLRSSRLVPNSAS